MHRNFEITATTSLFPGDQPKRFWFLSYCTVLPGRLTLSCYLSPTQYQRTPSIQTTYSYRSHRQATTNAIFSFSVSPASSLTSRSSLLSMNCSQVSCRTPQKGTLAVWGLDHYRKELLCLANHCLDCMFIQ